MDEVPLVPGDGRVIALETDDAPAVGLEIQGVVKIDGLKQGDVVQIEHGPFEGYEAIFDARLPGNERVRVLLQLLNDRRVPVELDTADIAAHSKQKKSS